jgi:hypothetical protein
LFQQVPFSLEEIDMYPEFRRPRLLCYGHDEMLLYTRKCILERDYSVAICGGLARLGEILRQGPVHVVVLCHSVSDAECEKVMELSRAAWPTVKILVLQVGGHEECSLHSDKTMESLEGPPALLYKVHSMLGTASAGNAARG